MPTPANPHAKEPTMTTPDDPTKKADVKLLDRLETHRRMRTAHGATLAELELLEEREQALRTAESDRDIAEKFHSVAVQQRDAAWAELERLRRGTGAHTMTHPGTPQTPAPAPSAGEVLEMVARYVEAERAHDAATRRMDAEQQARVDAGEPLTRETFAWTPEYRAALDALHQAHEPLLVLNPAHLRALAALPAPAPAGLREGVEALTRRLRQEAASYGCRAGQVHLSAGMELAADRLTSLLAQHPTPPAGAGARKGVVWPATSDCCMAGRDGDCFWPGCPQERDGEPGATGRHCPLDAQAQAEGGN